MRTLGDCSESVACRNRRRLLLYCFDPFTVNTTFIIVAEAVQVKSLANPTKLKPLMKDAGLIQVIIETPANSRNKFAFDPQQGIFALKKVLPAGMVFPYDFGFVPSTQAEDGDPVDVLVLMDELLSPDVYYIVA